MRHLKRSVINFLRIILKIKARPVVSQLYNSDGVIKLLGSVLRESFENDLTEDERKFIDKIESLRKELDSSTKKISIVDYGAVEPGLNLTQKEMDKGNVITSEIGKVSWEASKPYFWSLILFKLVRKFKPALCLELGTCFGISGSFQAAALTLNGSGKFITLEGSGSLASLAEEHFKLLGLNNTAVVKGRFQDTLKQVLDDNRAFDYAFIDGHHDEQATINYFEQILPFFKDKALIVFDDISWSDGMKRAWKAIIENKKIKISLNLYKMGICVIDNDIESKQDIAVTMI